MSRKGVSSSKFGHLFGDTSDSSSTSSNQSRLSGTGDLYRDPLAALLPPVTATTTTTRGGATTVKATLSPPSSTTSASSATAAASSRGSPPGSGPNSRSSSRVQHHALFSSLAGDTGSSLFDSAAPASATLSAAKRDLLFGEGTSTSSSARRTSTPPLSRNNQSGTASSSQQSSRVSTPPLGVRIVTATTLDTGASPLGGPLEDNSKLQGKDDDILSIRSPLSTAPLTRTNSQASIKSHESVKSSRSAQSQETAEDAQASTLRNANVKPSATVSSGPALLSSARSAATARKTTSVDQPSKQSEATTPSAADPIFNPLTYRSQSPSQPTPSASSPSSISSQSIETFQSISRTSSPAAIVPPPPMSKSGFERENDYMSPPPVSRSRIPVNVAIMDDAAEAFAKDLLFTAEPAQPTISTSTLQSSSFLDSGFSSSRTAAASSSTSPMDETFTATTISTITLPVIKSGVGAGTVGQAKSLSGFSLGEDVADSSNPWMNTLADSLEQTKLARENPRIDYTQSDAGPGFAPEAAFTSTMTAIGTAGADATAITTTSTTTTTTTRSISRIPIPSLEDDIGGFDDVFSSLGSSKRGGSSNTGSSRVAPAQEPMSRSPPVSNVSSLTARNWNVLDAVEAAVQDPDFLGPTSLASQSTDKVLAIMQMPKDALDKDVSAQEVFDNPWE